MVVFMINRVAGQNVNPIKSQQLQCVNKTDFGSTLRSAGHTAPVPHSAGQVVWLFECCHFAALVGRDVTPSKPPAAAPRRIKLILIGAG